MIKFLGLYIDVQLERNDHVKYIKNKLNSSLYDLRKVKNILNTNHPTTVYYSLIYPYTDYGKSQQGSTHKTRVNKIFIKQIKNTIRTMAGAQYNGHTNQLFKQKLLNLMIYVN